MDNIVNSIICGDAVEELKKLQDNSVEMIITSPPYNVGMPYGTNDRKDYLEYFSFAEEWLRECYRILIVGGRIAINLPSSILGSKRSRMSYLSLDYVLIMRKIGFLDREWITWIKSPKGEVMSKTPTWGSFCSPSSPYLRDASEVIIIMDKIQHKRTDKKEEMIFLRKSL